MNFSRGMRGAGSLRINWGGFSLRVARGGGAAYHLEKFFFERRAWRVRCVSLKADFL